MSQDEQNSTFPWEPDHLVVDTRYAELVQQRLRDRLEVEVVDTESDSDLGLTLLFNLKGKTLSGKHEKLADLDPILAELRRGFAVECDGWVPEMGKNRLNEVVFPAPNPEIHQNRWPVSALDPNWYPSPDLGRGVRVGIVDTPLVPHSYLPDVQEEGEWKFEQSHPLPMRAGHSTFIAGLIKAKAPAAKIIVRAGVRSSGKGTIWQAAKEIAAFAKEEIDVMNLSLGCRTTDGQPPLIISRAIAQVRPSTVVVASAGNHGGIKGMVDGVTKRSPVWPAALPGIIAVGAIDKNGKRAAFSPNLPWVNHQAPGVDEISSYIFSNAFGEVELGNDKKGKFDGWAKWSGTSFAAANLTGEIAARTIPGKVTPWQAFYQIQPESTISSTTR